MLISHNMIECIETYRFRVSPEFDGTRRNDMYKIAVPEQLPRDEKRRSRPRSRDKSDHYRR